MPTSSVIPGVTVRTIFEPAPVLPGATGILGAVGVTDAGPIEPTAVGSFTEFLDVFGPASRFTMPEVRDAFANGVARAVIARTAAGRGAKATLILRDEEGEQVVKLIARAEGAWGNRLAARVTQVKTLSGFGVKYVNLELSLDGEVVETIDNLVMDVTSDHYLFDRVNALSRLVVAVDPLMDVALPSALAATALDASGARASTAIVKRGAAGAVTATAKRRGRAGDRLAVGVSDGHAALTLLDAANAPTAVVRARTEGPDGTQIKVAVDAVNPTTVRLAITPPGGALRTTANATTMDELVASVANDPDVVLSALGSTLPAALATTSLARTVIITVTAPGVDPRSYADLASLDDIVGVTDRDVAFAKVTGATQLPDSGPGVPLTGGRDDGPGAGAQRRRRRPRRRIARRSHGDRNRVGPGRSSGVHPRRDHSGRQPHRSGWTTSRVEVFGDVTMDPDDDRYLPAVLGDSALVRGIDLFVPSQSTSTPAALARATSFVDGISPSTDDYEDALERLETAEDVDLIIGCAATQLDDAGVRTVHQLVVAHCTKMADAAKQPDRARLDHRRRGAIAVGRRVLDHADDVRSDHFVLCTPARLGGRGRRRAGPPGLLRLPHLQDHPGARPGPGPLTDAQLEHADHRRTCWPSPSAAVSA